MLFVSWWFNAATNCLACTRQFITFNKCLVSSSDHSSHMTTQQQIKNYIASQPEAKRVDLEALHKLTLKISSKDKLWFNDGKNSEGKTVANPNIGYGFYTINYADGSTREFYRIGLSANTTGISVYILGLTDKTYLAKTYGKKIGKASVSGYCIKFKALKDIKLDVLEGAIRYGLEAEH